MTGHLSPFWTWDRGLERYSTGTGTIGTDTNTTAITIGRAGITTTFPGDVTISGVLAVVGGETFTGLVTVTSASGAGAAGVLGPEELLVQNTQAATGGSPIRNPGYLDFEGRFWTGAASVAGKFGSWGAVVDTQAAGVPSTYRMVWANAAQAIQWGVNQVGLTSALGAFEVRTAIGDAQPLASYAGTGLALGAGGAGAADWSLTRNGANRADLGSGHALNAVAAGVFAVRALAGDAQVSASVGSNSILLGPGGAVAPDVALSRGAADRLDLGSGDSLNSIAAGVFANRVLAADAQPAMQLGADRLSFGAGGASVTDVSIVRGGPSQWNLRVGANVDIVVVNTVGYQLQRAGGAGAGNDSLKASFQGQTSVAARTIDIYNEADAGADSYRFRIDNSAGTQIMTVDGATAGAGGGSLWLARGITSGATAADAHTFTATTWDVNASGAVTIDSSAGTIGIGTDANAQAINIGTGAAARTITIGNVTGATGLMLNAGTGASSWTVTGLGTFTLTAGTGAIALATNATDHATSVGSGTGASTGVFDCGTGGLSLGTTANAHTTTIGSPNTTSTTTIDAGTGGVNIGQSAAARTWNFGAGAGANIQTANLFTNAAANVVAFGSTTAGATITLNGGTSWVATGVAATTYTIGDAVTTGTITVGQSTATNTINIGSANTATGATQIINIGAGVGVGTGTSNITIGDTTGSGILTLRGGTGASLWTTANGAWTVTTGTGAIGIGTDAFAKTITMGNATGATAVVINAGTGASSWTVTGAGSLEFVLGVGTFNLGATASARTINLGTGAAAQTVLLGSTTAGSSLRLQSPTAGGIGFFTTAPVVQQTGPTVNITNNVTAGGVDGTIANFTDLTTYANDAAAIRNDIYQLARALKFASDALRAYGLIT